MSFNYKVYGLNIKSQIEINEFNISDNKDNDVEIILGEVSEDIKLEIKNNKRAAYTNTEIWFHIEGIATYYIKNGDTIIVEPCKNTNINILRVYLMCSCLGFIMLQRNMVAIHGGVIEMDNKAVIFTGDRGAGKSTLTTALRQKGYKFISDDVAAINFNENIPYVAPGFPYQKLCEDAMDNMGYNKEECTSFMSDTKVKYMVPAHNEFVDSASQLFAICELTVGDIDEVVIEECIGSEKLNKIIDNIYRVEFIKYLGGLNPIYFRKCLDIAKNIRFYKITRPEGQFTVDEQIKLIERNILNYNELVV